MRVARSGGLIAHARTAFSWVRAAISQRIPILTAVAALTVASAAGWLFPIDAGLSALRAQLIQRAPSGQVAIVAIDAPSLRAAGEWPWRRSRYADVIQNLRNAGANVVGFDVDFSARSTPAEDLALRAALAQHSGTVVLPVFVQGDASSVSVPLAAFSDASVHGAVNIPVDADGIVRRYIRDLDVGGQTYGSLASVLAGQSATGARTFQIDYGIRADAIDVLSFEDVFRNTFDPARVRGKTILIGATALELGDEFATPTRPTMSGVFIHALALESILQQRALFSLSPLFAFLLAVGALLFLWPRSAAPLHLIVARHCGVLLLAVVGPFVLQRFAPIDANLGLVLAAQALAFWAHIRHELSRREAAIAFEREARLSHVAHHDPETQLANRLAMLNRLREHAGAEAGSVAVLVFGIDRFETLRGAIGYGRATSVVQRIAQSLVRYTGEAEVFHLSTSTLGQVLVSDGGWATGFEGLHVPIELDGQIIDAVLRVGVAFSEDGVSTGTLLERANIALDRARTARRDSMVFLDNRQEDPGLQLAIVSDITRGLAQGQFKLLYQPKAKADTLEITGVEALMRWRHPKYGDIAPDRFIAVAEETGAIDELTRWALRRAVTDGAKLTTAGVSPSISINISGRSLSDAAFREFAVHAAKHSKVRLCFEITETAIISDPQAALDSIRAFRSAGIAISVDDYGSGFSSLAYLREIAGDELKLDKSLISEVTTSARDRVILKSTIDLAHALKMKVVAEGVEDDLTRIALRALGCDLIQGYFVSKPLPLGLLYSLLRDGAAAGVALPESARLEQRS